MDLASRVIAPEELVAVADGFSGQHLPGGAGVAGAGWRAEVGDGCGGGANANVGLSGVDGAEEAGVALRLDRGKGRTDN